jgi:hypothetical protein
MEITNIMAKDVKKVFSNWKEWAKTDWREFSYFFHRKWGVEAFLKAEEEFANQLNLSTHVLSQLTEIGVGKLMEKGVSSSLSNIVSIGDTLSKLAGFGYVAAWNSIQGRTRENPIKCIDALSDGMTFDEDQLKDYVQFILYWYPKDLAAGFYGFRYGGVAPLRTDKKIDTSLSYGR